MTRSAQPRPSGPSGLITVAVVWGLAWGLAPNSALGDQGKQAASATEDQESDAPLTAARVAMANREWAEAELLLERALMLRPHSAEALFELAQLLARRGRIDESAAMIRSLAEDPRTPAPQRASLNQLLADLRRHQGNAADAFASTALQAKGVPIAAASPSAPTPAAAGTPGLQWRVEALAGHSSNPLVATSASSITLTLPDGTFQLPLETRPQAGNYGGLTAVALAPGGAELLYQAQQVDVAGQQAAHRVAASVPGQLPFVGKGIVVARTQQFGDGSRRYQLGVQQGAGDPGGLVPAGTLYIGMYREPERSRRGFEWRWELPLPSPTPRLQAGVWTDGDTNHDVGAPPQVGIGARASVAWGTQWQLHAQLHALRDTRGYNPLLENNSRRWMLNRHLAIDYLPQSAAARDWLVRFYDAGRMSNLPLFAWRDYGMQLIWRKSW